MSDNNTSHFSAFDQLQALRSGRAKTLRSQLAAVEGVSRRSRPTGRCRRHRGGLAAQPAEAACLERYSPGDEPPVPGVSGRPNRRGRAWRACHQDRLCSVSDRLDQTRRDQGDRHERVGGDPRFRAGLRRQDQRRRRAATARAARSAWPAKPPTPSPSPPARRRERTRPRLGAGPSISTKSTVRMQTSSLVLAAYRAGIPCTVHVALGTDIVHMHPHVSGAALGEASLIDFRISAASIATHGSTASG